MPIDRDKTFKVGIKIVADSPLTERQNRFTNSREFNLPLNVIKVSI